MAEQTAVSFGDSNRGFQVGQNSGSITAEFHLLPGMFINAVVYVHKLCWIHAYVASALLGQTWMR